MPAMPQPPLPPLQPVNLTSAEWFACRDALGTHYITLPVPPGRLTRAMLGVALLQPPRRARDENLVILRITGIRFFESRLYDSHTPATKCVAGPETLIKSVKSGFSWDENYGLDKTRKAQ